MGQVRGGDVGLGPLVRGKVERRGGPQGLLGIARCGAALGHEGGADALAPPFVVQSEDGHLGDPRHRRQHILDLGRVDVDAPADDEVVPASRKGEVAVGREPAQVPHRARRPAPRPGGGLGVAPVAEAGEVGHVAPDHAAFLGRLGAGVLVVGDRLDEEPAAGPGPAHTAGVLEPLAGRADAELRLGRAVELPDGAGVRPRHGGPLHRLGTGRARVGQEAQRVEVLVGAEAGVLQDALEVRRDEEGGGRAVAPQHIERGRRIEAAQDGERPARAATCWPRTGSTRCGTSANTPDGGRPDRSATPTPRPRRPRGRWPRPRSPSSRPWGVPSCPTCSAWAASADRAPARPDARPPRRQRGERRPG